MIIILCNNFFLQNKIKHIHTLILKWIRNENCTKCNNKLSIVCSTCKGNGGLKLFNKKTSIEDCIYDVSIKCKEKSIPLSIILKSKGSLIVNEHNFKVWIIFSQIFLVTFWLQNFKKK